MNRIQNLSLLVLGFISPKTLVRFDDKVTELYIKNQEQESYSKEREYNSHSQ
ncbi:MAG: hypothetical protein U9Q06_01135 [Nanoarchaeota archaeon]|nr:hypothetical protein [Nanoarchaeota archaeon]